MSRPFARGTARTEERSARSCVPASPVVAHGDVAISHTDSMSSGLTSPCMSASRSWPMAFVSSRVSPWTIISSSSIPME